MNNKDLYRGIGEIDNDILERSEKTAAGRKKPVWLKWGAMAACLCLLVVGTVVLQQWENIQPQGPNTGPVPESDLTSPGIDEDPGNAKDYVMKVIYNDAEYVVCGKGEASILEDCGLPTTITEEHAGEFLCYLDSREHDRFYPCEEAGEVEDNDVALFEYAPMPNENVYIFYAVGEYYAAILKDADGYHGLPD